MHDMTSQNMPEPSAGSYPRYPERRQNELTARIVNEILIYQKQGGSLENRMIASLLATLSPDIQQRVRNGLAVFRRPGGRG